MGQSAVGSTQNPASGGKIKIFPGESKNSIFPPFGPSTPGGSSGRALAAAEEAARLAKAGGRQDPTRAPSTPTRAAKRNRDVPTKALRRRANALPTPPRRDNRYNKTGTRWVVANQEFLENHPKTIFWCFFAQPPKRSNHCPKMRLAPGRWPLNCPKTFHKRQRNPN